MWKYSEFITKSISSLLFFLDFISLFMLFKTLFKLFFLASPSESSYRNMVIYILILILLILVYLQILFACLVQYYICWDQYL